MVETALLHWTIDHVLSLMLIMLRVGPMIFLMPVIGSSSVPTPVKGLFTLAVALVLLPVVRLPASLMPATATGVLTMALTEFAFAATLALFARFLFAATDLAGQMVSISMGMGMAGTMDPQFGTQVSLISYFWNILVILIFLGINGHHVFFRVMVESFQWLRPGSVHLTDATFRGVVGGITHMFVLAIQIMAPAAVALFLANVAMGIIAKTVPQVPVMIVAMPLNIAIGFLFIALSLQYILPLMIKNFDQLARQLTLLGMGMGG